MGRKSFGGVIKSFRREVEQEFGPSAEALLLEGPEYDEIVMPGVSYGSTGTWYRFALDTHEMKLFIHVELERLGRVYVADLPDVAKSSGIRDLGRPTESARTLHELRNSLRSARHLIHAVHPLLTVTAGVELMRRAGAREIQRD